MVQNDWKVNPCKITYNGIEITPVRPDVRERLNKLYGPRRWNYFDIPVTASAYGEGHFLVNRTTMIKIIAQVTMDSDAQGSATLVFDSYDNKATIPHVFVGPMTRQIHTTGGQSIYDLHLVDQRYLATRMYNLGEKYYNMTADAIDQAADTDNFFVKSLLSETDQYTWHGIIDDIWDTALVGQGFQSTTTAGLLSGTIPGDSNDPVINPRDYAFIHTPATIALDSILRVNGWLFVYNPYSTAANIEDMSIKDTNDLLDQVGKNGTFSNIYKKYLRGGFTHHGFTLFDGQVVADADYGNSLGEEGEVKRRIGSDLVALPIPSYAMLPENIRILFPNKFGDGNIPTSTSNGFAANQYSSVTVTTSGILVNEVPGDESSAVASVLLQQFKTRIKSNTVLCYRDVTYAEVEGSEPFESITNATELNDRADYLAARVFGAILSPNGEVVYHGWHPIVPGREIYMVSFELTELGPITKINTDYKRPGMMFTAGFDAEATQHEIVGIGNTQVIQRPDGTYAIRGGGGGAAADPCNTGGFDLQPLPDLNDICPPVA